MFGMGGGGGGDGGGISPGQINSYANQHMSRMTGQMLSFYGYKTGKAAGKAQVATLEDALAQLGDLYRPSIQTGNEGMVAVADLLGLRRPEGFEDRPKYDFTKTPGYDFRFKQGRDALESSAAARGGLLSGATGQDLVEYGQEFASGEYDRALARLLGITDIGERAKQSLGASMTALFPELAEARAQRYIMPYNGVMAGFNSGLNLLGALEAGNQGGTAPIGSEKEPYQNAFGGLEWSY